MHFPTPSSGHDVCVVQIQRWAFSFFHLQHVPALHISNGKTAKGQCFYLTQPEIRQRATDDSWGLFCSPLEPRISEQTHPQKLNNLQLKFLKVKDERLSVWLCFKRYVTKQ